jgi:hypothetical protein
MAETILLIQPATFFPLTLKVIFPATVVVAVMVLIWRKTSDPAATEIDAETLALEIVIVVAVEVSAK